ncbi:MAG TPA: hypothetical protein VGM83_14990 [Devosiaceae bacterium]|jgi:hypothetical protein
MAARFQNGSFKPAGDPDKAAQILLQVAELPEPPLHLILGQAAYKMVHDFETARLEADKQWQHLSFATEAED